jgi:hypothetical protein
VCSGWASSITSKRVHHEEGSGNPYRRPPLPFGKQNCFMYLRLTAAVHPSSRNFPVVCQCSGSNRGRCRCARRLSYLRCSRPNRWPGASKLKLRRLSRQQYLLFWSMLNGQLGMSLAGWTMANPSYVSLRHRSAVNLSRAS